MKRKLAYGALKGLADLAFRLEDLVNQMEKKSKHSWDNLGTGPTQQRSITRYMKDSTYSNYTYYPAGTEWEQRPV